MNFCFTKYQIIIFKNSYRIGPIFFFSLIKLNKIIPNLILQKTLLKIQKSKIKNQIKISRT